MIHGRADHQAIKPAMVGAYFRGGQIPSITHSNVDSAQAALKTGYADQSHLIAEFGEFSGLTPHRLTTERWFHPFIEHARVKQRNS